MNLVANTSNNNNINKLKQLLEELKTSYNYDLVSNNKEKKALKVIKKYLEQLQFVTKNDIYLL
ncbi:24435_t:CDS:2 [Cetraspora pellucida]|uniref:24435_t:CDS:1 n=1 Tax=Cetraspora pellucida TaxID=1433469 RepID=A0A9N8WN79_9GLOM|nr:24435_t:CDS:2 [Cetraspora pellucida]